MRFTAVNDVAAASNNANQGTAEEKAVLRITNAQAVNKHHQKKGVDNLRIKKVHVYVHDLLMSQQKLPVGYKLRVSYGDVNPMTNVYAEAQLG